MINKAELEKYIRNLPPKPTVVRQALELVERNELHQAGIVAESDPILAEYLRNFVNKPVFGFKNRVTNLPQIFSILGIKASSELLKHYLMTLIIPKKWGLFDLNDYLFNELQARLSFYWKKILQHEHISNKDISSAIALLPATIIICDNLFHANLNEVNILRENNTIDFNLLLKRLTGMSLFDLTYLIGKYWSFPKLSLDVIKSASTKHTLKDKNMIRLGQWMHLLFFYVLSRKEFVESGLNSFINFNIDYVSPVYKDFQYIVEQNSNETYN
jgi:hypothetical protein